MPLFCAVYHQITAKQIYTEYKDGEGSQRDSPPVFKDFNLMQKQQLALSIYFSSF